MLVSLRSQSVNPLASKKSTSLVLTSSKFVHCHAGYEEKLLLFIISTVLISQEKETAEGMV